MKLIGKWQGLDEVKGASVLKLALSVGNITSGAAGMIYAMPPTIYFDDNLFFEVRADEKAKKFIPRPESQVQLHGKTTNDHSTFPMSNRRDSLNGHRDSLSNHHDHRN
jgi:hypothetical protein